MPFIFIETPLIKNDISLIQSSPGERNCVKTCNKEGERAGVKHNWTPELGAVRAPCSQWRSRRATVFTGFACFLYWCHLEQRLL